MEAILDRMDEIAGGDHFARVELNREFHFVMVRALGNEVLSELYQSLGARQQRVAMRALAADPVDLPCPAPRCHNRAADRDDPRDAAPA